MNANDILTAVNAGEDKDWEFKSAKGGMPGSLWETYSAMANTDGGVIVLGVKEDDDGSFDIHGLDDPVKMEKNFWSSINDRGKVNANILSNDSVQVVSVDGKPVLVVQVPRASRRQRPIFVGQNPLEGTYRRFNDGDYKCNEGETRRMLADQLDDSLDGRVVEHFGVDDLDPESLRQYRQIFAGRSPTHPWIASPDLQFLEQIGAWRKDRTAGVEGITFAGLMMFGKDRAICDPAAVPEFHLDYRERLSSDPNVRWTDRIWPDGTWTANLFQFYQRVVHRLTADLKIPFQLQPGMVRKDDTLVHEAIRETFVNAIIHADFRGQGGIIVEKYRDRFEFSNPGTLLLSVEQILKGGVSECRNRLLQTMFSLLGYGERAGSGFNKIRQGWASQNWRLPMIEETLRPDRVRLVLPMVSLLPEESVERIKGRFGTKFRKLSPLEVQALVTADLEGGVSNLRIRQISSEHPTELTKLLQSLVSRGFMQQDGRGRGTTYRLPGPGDSSVVSGDSSHSDDSSQKLPVDSSHKLEEIPAEELTKMRVLAAPAYSGMRLPPEETRKIILGLCRGRFLTANDLGELMNRRPQNLRGRFLTPLVEEGLLVRKYPAEPNRPDQAYTTKEKS
jgi:ATP-dependent DNA helicase RecG